MIQILMNSGRQQVISMTILAFIFAGPAQSRGGVRTVHSIPPRASAERLKSVLGEMVKAAKHARAMANAHASQKRAAGQMRGHMSEFYFHQTPYPNFGADFPASSPTSPSFPSRTSPSSSGGGYASVAAAQVDTLYGAAIQSAGSGVLADNIASQQADFQAAFQNLDLRERRLQLKRAAFDEARYERMNTPAPETVREERRQQRLIRARNMPPLDEIVSGQTLNDLLDNVQRVQAHGLLAGTSISLDPNDLAHLNITTTGDQRGSNEMFRPGALSKWPDLLNRHEFAADKKAMLSALAEASRSQANGSVNEAKTAEARRLIETMRGRLFDMRFQATMLDYAKALEFLNKLGGTIDLLAGPNSTKYLNGTYAANGSSVGEMADRMIAHGLKFARATPGDEPNYSRIYQKLATYEISLSRKTELQTADSRAR